HQTEDRKLGTVNGRAAGSMIQSLRTSFRFAAGLQSFLSRTLSPGECRDLVTDRLHRRDQSFLHLVEGAIFRNDASPYRPLFRLAGVGLEDVSRWVRQDGIEETLNHLYEKGVWVTLEEFKGRRALERPGLTHPLAARDFDNPLITRHFSVQSGGSRGPRTLLFIDFDHIEHEAAQERLFLEAFDLISRPMAIWRPVPPGSAGLKAVLRRAKLGTRLARWFTQTRPSAAPSQFGYLGVTYLTCLSGRLWGRGTPFPQHVPLGRAATVARWLADLCRAGEPAVLDTLVSSGVRACLAASDAGLDLRGTFFRLSGEPLTEAKGRVVAEAGSRAVCHYSMAEFGRLGLACASAEAIDDVHILADKVAVIQQPRETGGRRIPAFFLTSVHSSSPKIAINVESGDYGVLAERDCGCLMGRLGFRQHAHTIRSYEKLTTEGMHFLGGELLNLLEEVLPQRFGGAPTDYQLLEMEDHGMTRLSLVVSPRVGAVDEARLVAHVLEALGRPAPGSKMMAEHWRQGATIHVVRRDPVTTRASKIQPLHVPQKGDAP
ncbi:MAG: hypothetical protein ACRDG5_00145, partial [Anaerolineales bacterium]